MSEITIEDCMDLKDKFRAYCDRAEQYEFPMLIVLDQAMQVCIDRWRMFGVPPEDARAMFRTVLKYMGEDFSEYEEKES